jgi:ketosteroid isomerase-like protein
VRDLAGDDGGAPGAAGLLTVERDRVTRLYEVINRVWGEDPSRHRDLIREFAHPDIELVVPPEYIDIGELRGYDGLERWLRMAATVFDSWRYDIEDVLDARDDRVMAMLRLHVRGKESGVEMEFAAAHLIEFEEGRVRRLTVYRDREEGLLAAGLS